MEDAREKALLTVPRFERIPGLIHGFGTAAWTPEDLRKLAEGDGFRLVVLKQVHSDIVHAIDESNLGRASGTRLEGDALVTKLPRVLLVVKTADCLPVFLADEAARVIAAVHCGWKGTLGRIIDRVLDVLSARFGSDPAGLLAALGPCIGGDCYEVGEEVRSAFARAGFPEDLFKGKKAPLPVKYLLDLRAANVAELLAKGVRGENISSVEACTRCETRFLSYRRDRDKERRMMSFLALVR